MTARAVTQMVGFVDAGFLRAEGARVLNSRPNWVRTDARACVSFMRELAQDEGASLLRVYWYEAAFDSTDPSYVHQRRYLDGVASVPGIQLRLGHISTWNPAWHDAVREAIRDCGWDVATFEQRFSFRPEFEQKGVDTLIVLDMVRLAQRHAFDTAVLISGDRDLAEAVRTVQDEGRRVVLGHPMRSGVATELRQLADEVRALDDTELRAMITVRT